MKHIKQQIEKAAQKIQGKGVTTLGEKLKKALEQKAKDLNKGVITK